MSKTSLEKQAKIVAEIIAKEKDFANIGDVTVRWLKKRGMSKSILLAVPDVDYKKIGKYPPVYSQVLNKKETNSFNLDMIAMFLSAYARAYNINEAKVIEELSKRVIDIAKYSPKFEEM